MSMVCPDEELGILYQIPTIIYRLCIFCACWQPYFNPVEKIYSPIYAAKSRPSKCENIFYFILHVPLYGAQVYHLKNALYQLLLLGRIPSFAKFICFIG